MCGLLAQPGEYPSNDGYDAFGIALGDSGDIVFGPGVKISCVYGGAGASGRQASPDGGSGGAAYAVFLEGANSNISL